MGQGGIARRLINSAKVLVGMLPGGLAYVNILACMFFGAIPGSAVYAPTKGAIWTLTKSMAKELGPDGIQVNCIAPGFIANTDFHNTLLQKRYTKRLSA